jgi:hypothetical protein
MASIPAARSIQLAVKLFSDAAKDGSDAESPHHQVVADVAGTHFGVSTASSARYKEKGVQQLDAECDAAFGKTTSNSEFYEQWVSPLILALADGYDCSLLSFGGVKCGQEQLWLGGLLAEGAAGAAAVASTSVDECGCLKGVVDQIFSTVPEVTESHDTLITLSVCQVVNEHVMDLLNPRPKRTLMVDDHPTLGAVVQDAAEIECNKAEEMVSLLRQALMVRRSIHARSRSPQETSMPHTLINIRYLTKSKVNSKETRGSLLRIALLSEYDVARSVDRGSGVFFQCIKALGVDDEEDEVKVVVPYRSSSLTRLLQPVLSGQTYCHVVALANSGLHRVNDTIHTNEVLQQWVIAKTTHPVAGAPSSGNFSSTLRRLRRDLERWRAELLEIADVKQSLITEEMQAQHRQTVKRYQATTRNLYLLKANTWDRIKEASLYYMQARQVSHEQEGLSPILTELQFEPVPESLRDEIKTAMSKLVDDLNKLNTAEFRLADQKHKYNKLRRVKLDQGMSAAELEEDATMKKLDSSIKNELSAVSVFTTELGKGRESYTAIISTVMENEDLERRVSQLHAMSTAREGLSQIEEVRLVLEKMGTDEELMAALKSEEELSAEKVKIIEEKFAGLPEASQEYKQEYVAHAQTAFLAEKNKRKLRFQCVQMQGRMVEHDSRHEYWLQKFKSHSLDIFTQFREGAETDRRRMEATFKNMMGKCVDDTLRLREENQLLQWKVMQAKAASMRL